MSVSFEIFRGGQNASASVLAGAINAFLATVNPISIVNLEKKWRGRSGGEQLDILLAYKTNGANYQAQGFIGTGGNTANAQAQVWFAANPNFRIKRVIDVSNPFRRKLGHDAFIVMGMSDYSVDQLNNEQMAIVQAQVLIDAGDTGAAVIMTSAGATGATIQVTNWTTTAWAAGTLGYAVPDPTTGEWLGHPNCC